MKESAEILFIRLKSYRFPIAVFISSRIVIWIGFFLAASIFVRDKPVGDALSQLWLRWDAGWYISIAVNGYQYNPAAQSSIAFFPLLPILIRTLGQVIDPILAGELIVNACVLGAYVVLYALVRLEFPTDKGAAKRTLLYIAFFPTAIFSLFIFTESIYLLLALVVFYFARRGMWSVSIAAAILCSATRVQGSFLWVVVVLEWARAQGLTLRTIGQRRAWRSLVAGVRASPFTVIAIALIPLGLISYMLYLNSAYNAPLAFYQAQAQWGRSIGPPFTQTIAELKDFFPALWSGRQMAIDTLFNDPALVLTLIVAVFVCWRLGTSYGLFTLASILIPASTSMTSYIRYVSVIFPIFMILALWGKRSIVHQLILGGFCTLLGIVLVIYISGTFLA